MSRVTFYKLSVPFCQSAGVALTGSTAFVGSCLVISLLAAGNSGRDSRSLARAAAGMASGAKLV